MSSTKQLRQTLEWLDKFSLSEGKKAYDPWRSAKKVIQQLDKFVDEAENKIIDRYEGNLRVMGWVNAKKELQRHRLKIINELNIMVDKIEFTLK